MGDMYIWKQTILVLFLLGGVIVPAVGEPIRLVMFGPPGAGKGTQAKQLSAHYGVPHISVGAMLRDHIGKGSELGKKAKKYVEKGELVPDELMMGMLRETLQGASSGYILDGFPRSEEQAEILSKLLEELDQRLNAVIYLNVPDEVVLDRLLSRGREDDTREVIEKRLQVFNEVTRPVLDYYQGNNLLIRIDGVGSVDQVQQKIRVALSSKEVAR